MQEDFKIFIQETRVYRNQDGEMIFEGTASSETLDSHRTRFNAEAQEGFSFDIMKGMEDGEPVELEAEHKGEEEPMNILGPVIVGTVSADNKLMIRAKLDPDNPKAVYYFNKMTKPDPITKKVKKFGLSINGTVEKAHFEYDKEAGTHIEIFDRVRLKRIGIVRRPSNPDCWVEKIIRSVNWEEVKTHTNNQERLTNQMSDPKNQELDANRSDVVDAVADAPVVVADVVDADADVKDEVREAEPVADAAGDEAGAEVDADADAERSEADAKVDDAPEAVTRTSYWMSHTLLDAMEEVSNALCTLEDVTTFDGEVIDAGMGQDCVDAGKALLNKMIGLFGDHINTKREADDSAAIVTEAEVKTEDADPVKVDADEDASKEELRNDGSDAETKVDVKVDAEQIIRAVSDMLDNDYTERMVKRFEESQKTLLDSLDVKFAELKSGNEALVRTLDEVKDENTKLVARLTEIEKLPASRPGKQILEAVNRTQVDSEKKAANLERAKAENNTAEIFNHKVFGNAYLGYGEYAKV